MTRIAKWLQVISSTLSVLSIEFHIISSYHSVSLLTSHHSSLTIPFFFPKSVAWDYFGKLCICILLILHLHIEYFSSHKCIYWCFVALAARALICILIKEWTLFWKFRNKGQRRGILITFLCWAKMVNNELSFRRCFISELSNTSREWAHGWIDFICFLYWDFGGTMTSSFRYLTEKWVSQRSVIEFKQ